MPVFQKLGVLLMLVSPLLPGRALAQATADYACYFVTDTGRVVNLESLCQNSSNLSTAPTSSSQPVLPSGLLNPAAAPAVKPPAPATDSSGRSVSVNTNEAGDGVTIRFSETIEPERVNELFTGNRDIFRSGSSQVETAEPAASAELTESVQPRRSLGSESVLQESQSASRRRLSEESVLREVQP